MFKFFMRCVYVFENVYSFQALFISKLLLINEIYRLFFNENMSAILR